LTLKFGYIDLVMHLDIIYYPVNVVQGIHGYYGAEDFKFLMLSSIHHKSIIITPLAALSFRCISVSIHLIILAFLLALILVLVYTATHSSGQPKRSYHSY
jgi:hypothetical protein